MAQKALFFTTNGTGDGAGEYTQLELFSWIYRSFGDGVLKGYETALQVTNIGLTCSVAAGAANVEGAPYVNTASVTITLPLSTVGTTGHRIVLRKNYTAQTVRITLLSSTDGVATAPSPTQISGVTWDVTLCTATVTTGGDVTLTDARQYAKVRSSISGSDIDDTSITAKKWNPQPIQEIVSEPLGITVTTAFDSLLIQQGSYTASYPGGSFNTIFIEFPSHYSSVPFSLVYKVEGFGLQSFEFIRNFTTSGIAVTYSGSSLFSDVFHWFASGEAA
jgi:hypothetical protein